MRVLITRPEREATALATALIERGHVPVIAPLFRLEILRPPPDFADALAACQTVLLTSANGARALAEASEQRGKPILAVGDTTASTAEGLGFAAVVSAAGDGTALAALVRRGLDPKKGSLVHVSGVDVALDLAETLAPDGFEVHRFALYDAREESVLPESARAALAARALDAATFFSSRAASAFAKLVGDAGLADSLRDVTAIAISPAALDPLAALPFKATVAAVRPTRQAVLDEIDRLAEAGVQGARTMSDTPSPAPDSSTPSAPPPVTPTSVTGRRGLGVFGAFITGLIAAVLVLVGAMITLPFWPEEIRAMWRGQGEAAAPTPAIDLQAVRADATAIANAAVEASRRDLGARIDDLEKRVRALSATAAEPPRPSATADAEKGRIEQQTRMLAEAEAARRRAEEELKAIAEARKAVQAATPPAPASPDSDKDLAALRLEIATLRSALQTLDQAMAGQKDETARQREQAKALADTVDRARAEASAVGAGEKKALGAARASAVIGVAARLSSALESGLPFAPELGLLAPLAQGDSRLSEIIAALQPYAQAGVASRVALMAAFPAVAKAALADDLADDSFGERLLGKIKGLVSLRRVGADVPGDAVEAKLARAEAALEAGDLAKAVDLVKSLPPQTAKATSAWLARAEAHLAAKRAVDQLSSHAVTLLGAAR
ncbi:MAG: uroporphyrinogen-III synthase [Reyranella sp.]|uniref:uroporphyrinogen-III synthase n=1 Tax=Reyranella sp. TaxID=1929291 RepID=UPI001206AE64|nr:uroporphyrinogen-III synthase [Reyranella sp.]TAJ36836.1 MAG: uroporphyrinogen-III synthase [Reyranella sp.]